MIQALTQLVYLEMILNANQSNSALVAAISHQRLSNYRRFFRTSNDDEAIGLYRWNEEVGSSLFKLFGLLEVVLRNQFHSALSSAYGVAGSAASKDWYVHLQLSSLSKTKINEQVCHRRRGPGGQVQWIPKTPVPRPDDVISNLTFGFWQHLFDVTHDTTGGRISWGNLIPLIVPGHRQKQPAHWRQQTYQDELFGRIDLCKELRNRIAHHEPIWKQGVLLEESRDRPQRAARQVVAAAPTTSADVVARLVLLYERTCELLGWLSPAVLQGYAGSQTDLECRTLLTERALEHYRLTRSVAQVEVTRFGANRQMKQLIKYASRARQPMHLTHNGVSLGHWYCSES